MTEKLTLRFVQTMCIDGIEVNGKCYEDPLPTQHDSHASHDIVHTRAMCTLGLGTNRLCVAADAWPDTVCYTEFGNSPIQITTITFDPNDLNMIYNHITGQTPTSLYFKEHVGTFFNPRKMLDLERASYGIKDTVVIEEKVFISFRYKPPPNNLAGYIEMNTTLDFLDDLGNGKAIVSTEGNNYRVSFPNPI
jgi:hypothetical protein